ncbi:MAG: hypothetical protein Q9163_004816 [Psora crenata]
MDARRKIKCGEQKPTCENCEKTGQACDYSIKLNWDGRNKKKGGSENHMTIDTLQNVQRNVRERRFAAVELEEALQHKTPCFKKPYQELRPPTLNTLDLNGVMDVTPTTDPAIAPISRYAKLRVDDMSPYPSPADSNLNSSPLPSSKRCSYDGAFQPLSLSDMPPPLRQSPLKTIASSTAYVNHGQKRACLSPSMKTPDSLPGYQAMLPGEVVGRTTLDCSAAQMWSRITSTQECSPASNSISFIPPSPAPSSIGSDDSQIYKCRSSSLPQQDRRMSIDSLVSGGVYAGSNSGSVVPMHPSSSNDVRPEKLYYGVDPGYPDLDIPFNNDHEALDNRRISLTAAPAVAFGPHTINGSLACSTESLNDKGRFLRHHQLYYKTPIRVQLPENFSPLPPILSQKPMNLLYFHHFICHTARILVPHDCSGNPFRKLLPETIHRSRLMTYNKPETRIRHYVDNMFATLGSAVADPQAHISNSTFATAIMLASLEIISPDPFNTDITISWETHLNTTREIITKRGIREKTVDPHDEETYFLTRWFAYLDVLGSLSGGRKDLPMFKGDFWAHDVDDDRQEHRIDCFFGFTTCCVRILAKLADLVQRCDAERRTAPDGGIWQPSSSIRETAKKIRIDLMVSMQQPYQGCQHGRRPSAQHDESTTHALELTTTNESYHWAGLIYLNRRVLGKPSSDDQIQDYVNIILVGLGKLRQGGTAEACMLFPIFIAGCEALEDGCRRKFSDRLRSVERTGLTQACTARVLMERVWDEKKPWEQVSSGQFIG